jgi:diguanylate cyclase (GGDEF)-like protein
MKTQASSADHAENGDASSAQGGGQLGARSSSRWQPRPVQVLLASPIVLGILVALFAALVIIHLRERALVGAHRELQNLTVILADQAERVFEGVEVVQNGLLDRVQSHMVETPDQFRDLLSGLAAHEDLRTRTSALPQLYALAAVDANGRLLNSSRDWPVPAENIADRDYFQTLTAAPAATMLISEPLMSRTTGEAAIYLARRISGPRGEFLGVILGVIQLRAFEQLYQAVVAGEGRAIALARPNGDLLARYPHIDLGIAKSRVTHPIWQLDTAGRNLRFQGVGPLDGIERLLSVQALTHYPLVVTASDTVHAVLADWRRQATYMGVSSLAFELMLAGIFHLMLRQLRAQRMLNESRAAQRGVEAALALAQERARAERELNSQNLRFSMALSNMSQGLCMCDAAERVVVANGRFADMLGLPADAVRPGEQLAAMLARMGESATLRAADSARIRGSIDRLKQAGQVAAWVGELSDGRSLSVHFTPLEDQGCIVTLEDVTEQHRAAARISHMAMHDALTGLPNRLLFHERLSEAVAHSRRDVPSAVLCLDLDHFKTVNDTLGHPVGDALLKLVTDRLRAQVRETDTVARLGGDEFAIIQFSADQPKDATSLATRLIETLSAPYQIDGHQVIIGTSVGIVVLPDDGQDPDLLLKNADLALYRAKADGRSRYRFFEREMDARMQARRALEMDLRQALANGEFEVFYQPLMNVKSRTVTGFEALLRWCSPQRGVVPPAEFIPLAEEIGLIIPLGGWVLSRACTDAATWPGGVKVAVNLSPLQFASRTLVEDVAAALAASGLEPRRLELEITETVMLEDTETVLAILHRLRNLGVGIAMDDFGTGYSSLSYLRRFPFDKVKIDRSFIEGLGGGGDSEAIVTAVVELCESLGMITTAEGVETEDQLRLLISGSCTEAQGYLFSRPRPASEVAELCRSLNAAEAGAI